MTQTDNGAASTNKVLINLEEQSGSTEIKTEVKGGENNEVKENKNQTSGDVKPKSKPNGSSASKKKRKKRINDEKGKENGKGDEPSKSETAGQGNPSGGQSSPNGITEPSSTDDKGLMGDGNKDLSFKFEFKGFASFSNVGILNSTQERIQLMDVNSRVINVVEGMNPDDTYSMSQSPLVKKFRNTLVKTINLPDPSNMLYTKSILDKSRIRAIASAMSQKGIFTIYKNFNIGGFISSPKDEYTLKIVKEKEGEFAGSNVLDDEKTENGDLGNLMFQLIADNYLLRQTKDVAPESRSEAQISKDNEDNQDLMDSYGIQRIDFKRPTGYMSVMTNNVKFNEFNDTVPGNAAGDIATREYKKSLRIALDNLAKSIDLNKRTGFRDLVKNPAKFRTVVEEPIKLANLLVAAIRSINSALSNQHNVIDRIDIPDPGVAWLMRMNKNTRTKLKDSIRILYEYVKSIPHNSMVIKTYDEFGKQLKLLDENLDKYNNTLISGAFAISIPATALAFEAKGHDTNSLKEIKTEDLPRYGNSELASAKTFDSYALDFKIGSIFNEFLYQMKLYGLIPEKAYTLTLSKGRFTDFSTSLLVWLTAVRPTFLLEFLTVHSEFWSFLKENKIFEGTIFQYDDPEEIDLTLRKYEALEVSKVQPSDKLIRILPYNGLYHDKVTSSEITIDYETYGFETEVWMDDSVNVITGPKNQHNYYLTNCIIHPFIIIDNDGKYRPSIGNHGELAVNAISIRDFSKGENYKVMVNGYHTLTVNPLLFTYTDYFNKFGLNSIVIGKINDIDDSVLIKRGYFGNYRKKDLTSFEARALMSKTTPKFNPYNINKIFPYNSILSVYYGPEILDDKIPGDKDSFPPFKIKLRRRLIDPITDTNDPFQFILNPIG